MGLFRKTSGSNLNDDDQKIFDTAATDQHSILGQQEPDVYDQDGLRTGHDHEFMNDPRFLKAYKRGVKAVGIDYHWQWRVHIFLWAFTHAMHLEGDFVECGVYKGFMFSAAMTYTSWNKLDRNAYLFDTFEGLDESQLTQEEKELGRDKQFKHLYKKVYNEVKENFKEFKNTQLVKGSVPKTLQETPIEKVAFLALDMNNAKPEVAALRHFWPLMEKGAICLMDDYAYIGYHPQKTALDEVAKEFGVEIASLPTGQGILIKP